MRTEITSNGLPIPSVTAYCSCCEETRKRLDQILEAITEIKKTLSKKSKRSKEK